MVYCGRNSSKCINHAKASREVRALANFLRSRWYEQIGTIFLFPCFSPRACICTFQGREMFCHKIDIAAFVGRFRRENFSSFLLLWTENKSWALWEVISLSIPTMSDSQSWARTLFLAAHQTKSGKLSKKVSLFHKQSKSFALPSSAQALLFLPFTLRSSELGLKSEIQILLPLHLRCLFCLAKKRLFE